VVVGTPVKIGRSIGSSLYEKLPKAGKMAIAEATKAIYQTYLMATENLE